MFLRWCVKYKSSKQVYKGVKKNQAQFSKAISMQVGKPMNTGSINALCQHDCQHTHLSAASVFNSVVDIHYGTLNFTTISTNLYFK